MTHTFPVRTRALALLLLGSTAFLSCATMVQHITAQVQSGGNFTDVSSTHPNTYAIQYLRQRGIAKSADGLFRPDAFITRGEFIALVAPPVVDDAARADCLASLTIAPFADVPDPLSTDYGGYLCVLKASGFIKGYTDNTFRPDKRITAAETSVLLADIYKLSPVTPSVSKEWFAPAVKAMLDHGYFPPSVRNVSKEMTRAEIAEMLYRIIAPRSLVVAAQTPRPVTESSGMHGAAPAPALPVTPETVVILAKEQQDKRTYIQGLQQQVRDRMAQSLNLLPSAPKGLRPTQTLSTGSASSSQAAWEIPAPVVTSSSSASSMMSLWTGYSSSASSVMSMWTDFSSSHYSSLQSSQAVIIPVPPSSSGQGSVPPGSEPIPGPVPGGEPRVPGENAPATPSGQQPVLCTGAPLASVAGQYNYRSPVLGRDARFIAWPGYFHDRETNRTWYLGSFEMSTGNRITMSDSGRTIAYYRPRTEFAADGSDLVVYSHDRNLISAIPHDEWNSHTTQVIAVRDDGNILRVSTQLGMNIITGISRNGRFYLSGVSGAALALFDRVAGTYRTLMLNLSAPVISNDGLGAFSISRQQTMNTFVVSIYDLFTGNRRETYTIVDPDIRVDQIIAVSDDFNVILYGGTKLALLNGPHVIRAYIRPEDRFVTIAEGLSDYQISMSGDGTKVVFFRSEHQSPGGQLIGGWTNTLILKDIATGTEEIIMQYAACTGGEGGEPPEPDPVEPDPVDPDPVDPDPTDPDPVDPDPVDPPEGTDPPASPLLYCTDEPVTAAPGMHTWTPAINKDGRYVAWPGYYRDTQERWTWHLDAFKASGYNYVKLTESGRRLGFIKARPTDDIEISDLFSYNHDTREVTGGEGEYDFSNHRILLMRDRTTMTRPLSLPEGTTLASPNGRYVFQDGVVMDWETGQQRNVVLRDAGPDSVLSNEGQFALSLSANGSTVTGTLHALSSGMSATSFTFTDPDAVVRADKGGKVLFGISDDWQTVMYSAVMKADLSGPVVIRAYIRSENRFVTVTDDRLRSSVSLSGDGVFATYFRNISPSGGGNTATDWSNMLIRKNILTGEETVIPQHLSCTESGEPLAAEPIRGINQQMDCSEEEGEDDGLTHPSLSDDGRFLLYNFTTWPHIFRSHPVLFDRQTNNFQFLPSPGHSPELSGNGNVVTYIGTLMQQGAQANTIMRYDRIADTSLTLTERAAGAGAARTVMSDDGRYTVYIGRADHDALRNLYFGTLRLSSSQTLGLQCVLLYDAVKDVTQVIAGTHDTCLPHTRNPDTATEPLMDFQIKILNRAFLSTTSFGLAISGNGRQLAVRHHNGIDIIDLQNRTQRRMDEALSDSPMFFTDDGRFLAWQAAPYVANGNIMDNGVAKIHDLQTHITSRVTITVPGAKSSGVLKGMSEDSKTLYVNFYDQNTVYRTNAYHYESGQRTDLGSPGVTIDFSRNAGFAAWQCGEKDICVRDTVTGEFASYLHRHCADRAPADEPESPPTGGTASSSQDSAASSAPSVASSAPSSAASSAISSAASSAMSLNLTCTEPVTSCGNLYTSHWKDVSTDAGRMTFYDAVGTFPDWQYFSAVADTTGYRRLMVRSGTNIYPMRFAKQADPLSPTMTPNGKFLYGYVPGLDETGLYEVETQKFYPFIKGGQWYMSADNQGRYAIMKYYNGAVLAERDKGPIAFITTEAGRDSPTVIENMLMHPSGTYFVYMERPARNTFWRLMRYDFATKKHTHIASVLEGLPLEFSPSGNLLFYSQPYYDGAQGAPGNNVFHSLAIMDMRTNKIVTAPTLDHTKPDGMRNGMLRYNGKNGIPLGISADEKTLLAYAALDQPSALGQYFPWLYVKRYVLIDTQTGMMTQAASQNALTVRKGFLPMRAYMHGIQMGLDEEERMNKPAITPRLWQCTQITSTCAERQEPSVPLCTNCSF